MNRFVSAKAILSAVISAVALIAVGCGDDDGGGTGTGSITGEPVGPGVVSPKPADAAQVDVVLREWAVVPAQTSVMAGKIYFLVVDNQGPEDPHEFVLVRSDLAADRLPVSDNKVPENRVDIVDEIEPFTPRSKASITLDLTPGKYLFICNITEVEGGEVESHYQLGMRTAFTVQEKERN